MKIKFLGYHNKIILKERLQLNLILKGHFHENLVKGTRPTKIIIKGNLKLNLV